MYKEYDRFIGTDITFRTTPDRPQMSQTKSEMYSPSHFGPKRSPDTFRLEHSLVRNRPLNSEDFSHVVKTFSKIAFLTRFLTTSMCVKKCDFGPLLGSVEHV